MDEVEGFAKRLKISRLEKSLLQFVVEHRLSRSSADGDESGRQKLLQDLFLDTGL